MVDDLVKAKDPVFPDYSVVAFVVVEHILPPKTVVAVDYYYNDDFVACAPDPQYIVYENLSSVQHDK